MTSYEFLKHIVSLYFSCENLLFLIQFTPFSVYCTTFLLICALFNNFFHFLHGLWQLFGHFVAAFWTYVCEKTAFEARFYSSVAYFTLQITFLFS